MKSRYTVTLSTLFISMFILVANNSGFSGQNAPKAATRNAIPENLSAVFQKSCTPCHYAGGKFKAKFKVNFSKWDNYKPDVQAEKAKKICSVLLKDDMPPASERKTRPGIVPSGDQVDAICKWSATLQAGLPK